MNDRPPVPQSSESDHPQSSDVSDLWRASAGAAEARPRSDAVESGRSRLAILAAVFLVAFGAVGWRLFDLCLDPPEAKEHAVQSGLRAERADIVDRNGELLARDLTLYDISLNPDILTDKSATAKALASALPSKLDAKVLKKRFTSGKTFAYVMRDATPREADAVHSLGIPGVVYAHAPQRAYPQGSLFSHVLGYVNVDNKGIAGMELARDDLLRSRGPSGAPLQLSVDTQIQFAVRDVIHDGMASYGAGGGIGIVMDVTNGEVLSLVSLPDFDPNHRPNKNDDSMKNRATSSLYEMGSTFKSFTFAIGFETGTLKLGDSFDATHPIKVGGRLIHDFHAENKWLTATQVFLKSSNIGAAEMALRFGPGKQREYFQKFGILAPSPIELPEVAPPILQNQWGQVETATMAYGYGVAVSPVQLATGIAALVNGGDYIAPTLIKRADNVLIDRREVVSAHTCDLIRGLFRANVEDGTGKSANIPGYDVGGKTGTANKLLSKGGYAENQRVASFVSIFPSDAPRYLVLVMLDDPVMVPGNSYQVPTGGATAAPLSGLIIRRIAPILGMPPESQEVDAEEVLGKRL